MTINSSLLSLLHAPPIGVALVGHMDKKTIGALSATSSGINSSLAKSFKIVVGEKAKRFIASLKVDPGVHMQLHGALNRDYREQQLVGLSAIKKHISIAMASCAAVLGENVDKGELEKLSKASAHPDQFLFSQKFFANALFFSKTFQKISKRHTL